MRNMSFSMTTEQIRSGTKTVTRRLGWKFLKPGDVVMACEKCQGIKKGEKVKKIRPIRVVSVNRECLVSMVEYKGEDVRCEANKCDWYAEITRIEFEYLEES